MGLLGKYTDVNGVARIRTKHTLWPRGGGGCLHNTGLVLLSSEGLCTGSGMLTARWARITFRQTNRLILLTRQPLIDFRSSLVARKVPISHQKRTQELKRCAFSSMADSGEQNTPGAAAGGGEPVVKSAKQLKKDAKKKEKLEKFQQKQAKMAGQQKQDNSGTEARAVNH